MSNLLGENFKPYVAKQIKTRQDILGRRESGILSDSNSNEAIMWENGKTSYVALASSVDIKDSPIYKTNISVNVEAVQGATGAFTEEEQEELRENAGFPEPIPGTAEEEEAAQAALTPEQIAENNPFEVEWISALTTEQANEIATQIARGILGIGTQTGRINNLFYGTNTDKNIITLKRYKQVVDAFKTLFGRKWKAGFGGVPTGIFNEALGYEKEDQDPIDNGNLEAAIIGESAYDENDLANLKSRLYNDTSYAFLQSPANNPLTLTLNDEVFTSPLAGLITYKIVPKPGKTLSFDEQQRAQTSAVVDATFVAPSSDLAAVRRLDQQITTVSTVNTEFEEIGNDGLGTKRVKEALKLEGDPNQYLGNFVSRNLVLTNGTTFVAEDKSRTYKAGVANNLSTFNEFVYGFGGDKDFGLVAMPGLEGVDIKSKNMGSLREATVTLRANSERQFSLIDTVYCRIGYTMFLEWGHSVYFDNTPNYVSNPLIEGVPSLIPSFLKPEAGGTCLGPNQGIQKQIEKNRELSCGNYDAFMGRVTNFSWEFDPSGYYKVTLKLASIGDIIESLGVDQPLPNLLLENKIPALGIQPSYNSALETFLSIAATPNGTSNIATGKLTSKEDITNTYDVYKRTLVANNVTTETETNDLITGAIITAGYLAGGLLGGAVAVALVNETGAGEEVVAQNQTKASDNSPELRYERASTSKGKIISARASFGTNIYNYIRFGDILDFIKTKLLIYNSECDGEPIVDIDTNTETNFCYYSGANVSADPSKVMVRANLPLSLQKLYGYASRTDSIGDPYWSYGVKQSSIFSSPKAQIEEFVTDQAFTSSKNNLLAGKIMNIYFEYQYLLDEIESSRDSESKSLNLLKFLDSILTTANSSLGGVNKLAVRIKDDNIIEIYDQIPLYGSQVKAPSSSILNLYGIGNTLGGSFVKNFGITTELTPEFATQVTIGAQAQGSKDTTDALALSNWNYGLIDRWIPRKLSSAEVDETQTKEATNYESLIAIRDKLAFLWFGYSQGQVVNGTESGGVFKRELTEEEVLEFYRNRGEVTVNEETKEEEIDTYDQIDNLIENNIYYFKDFPTKQYSEFVKLQQNFLSLLHINSNFNSNQQGMLPININLDIEGLSGIRIYDQLPVDVRFIPNYYPQTLHWIIKGVSHSIVNNVWTTKLETIAVPKIEELPAGTLPTKSTRIANQAYEQIPDSDIVPQDLDVSYTPEELDSYTNEAFSAALLNAQPIPESSRPIVEKILNLARNPVRGAGVYETPKYQDLVAILATAVGEVGPSFLPRAESFNYSEPRARQVFGAIKKLTVEEALKLIPESQGGTGSEARLGNYVYGMGNAEFLKLNDNDPYGGYNFRGRGLSQMTFKSNYKAVQENIIKRFNIKDSSGNSVDLLTNPQKANDIDVAIAIHVYGKLTGQFGLRLNSSNDYLTSGIAIQKLQNGSNGSSKKETPNSVTNNYTRALAQIAKTPWIQELLKAG
jgi:predicted chitinase